MRRTHNPGTILLVAGLLFACDDSDRDAEIVEVTAAGDTLLTSYGEIAEAVWLGDKRWAVLAQPEEAVAIADFGRRATRRVGADKQLRNPSTLFFAEDTLYVGDWGLRRLTLWGPDARLSRTIPAPAVTRGSLPQARDSAGSYYLDLYPPPGPDGSGNRDSAAIVRSNPELTSVDTIARLAPFDIAEVVGEAGRRFERRVFSGNDHWGVLPDGSVWLARVYDNRVDWRSPDGQWIRGEPLPDRVLEVTRYDRELFLRRFPPELRRTARELPFAALKPPFEAGLTAPTGEVWLEKSRAPADSTRRYHVVDQRGRLVREVRLRGQGRIVALGSNSGLIAEAVSEGTRLIAMNFATQVAER
ncbi:MAG TPA: hypothetical protein VHH32_01885 [Gemmatimonadales bacterium]|nr:hypothetical protein [Gemmatimonadales bacterium]